MSGQSVVERRVRNRTRRTEQLALLPRHQHPVDCWCRKGWEQDRQRLLDLQPLSQPQQFLIRALTYGLRLGVICSGDLRVLRREHLELEAATLAFQSGALQAFEQAASWGPLEWGVPT